MIVRRWTKQANKLVTKRPYQTRVTRSSDCYLERNTNFSINKQRLVDQARVTRTNKLLHSLLL